VWERELPLSQKTSRQVFLFQETNGFDKPMRWRQIGVDGLIRVLLLELGKM
jgi:hypothetical protein